MAVSGSAPINNFSPAYNDRTIELCHGDASATLPTSTLWEAIGLGGPPGPVSSGMVNQAADFVAGAAIATLARARVLLHAANRQTRARWRGPWSCQDKKGVGDARKSRRLPVVKRKNSSERHDQHAEIIEVRPADGSPPYVVRWLANGHETTVYPGSTVVVTATEHAEVRCRAGQHRG